MYGTQCKVMKWGGVKYGMRKGGGAKSGMHGIMKSYTKEGVGGGANRFNQFIFTCVAFVTRHLY